MNTIETPPGLARTVDHAAARRWFFSGQAEELASLRQIVTWECHELGVPNEDVEAAVLAVDELAANAQVFGPFELRLYTAPLGWGIADCCPTGADKVLAHLTGGQKIPSLDEDGRGLLIVRSLFPRYEVTAVTVSPGLPGKEVRFMLSRDDAS